MASRHGNNFFKIFSEDIGTESTKPIKLNPSSIEQKGNFRGERSKKGKVKYVFEDTKKLVQEYEENEGPKEALQAKLPYSDSVFKHSGNVVQSNTKEDIESQRRMQEIMLE